LKIGIYARVSTDDQHNENQIFKLREYADLRGWDVVDVYQDVITGRKFSRPDLQRLKDDIRKRRVNGVLVWKIDRLGRSVRDMLDLAEFFDSHNTAIVIFNSNIDTTTPMGKYVFVTFAALAELERSQISERTKLAYERKKAKAKNLNQKVKWGRRRKVLSDEEFAVVSRCRASLMSWRVIADRINDMRRDDVDAEFLSYSTVRRLFQNRVSDLGVISSSND
jgi:DNA invertase Pin-like site-specific DNA recombinase